MKNSAALILWGFLAAICLHSDLYSQKKNISLQVKAHMVRIPLMAVDKQGHPVTDLRAEEIKMFVNRKPAPFRDFSRVDLSLSKPALPTRTPGESDEPAMPGKRLVFIIVDRLFTADRHLHRSCQIAQRLLETTTKADQVTLLSLDLMGGIRIAAGPFSSKKELDQALKKVFRRSPKNKSGCLVKEAIDSLNRQKGGRGATSPVDSFAAGTENPAVKNWFDFSSDSEPHSRTAFAFPGSTSEALAQARLFSSRLSRFSRMFYTRLEPKIIYLISQGHPLAESGFASYNVRKKINSGNYFKILYQAFRDLASEISSSGGILNLINPVRGILRNGNLSSQSALQLMADEIGGRYHSESDESTIISRVRSEQTAYYELFRKIPVENQKTEKIMFKCMRPGVRILAPTHSRTPRPYRNMDQLMQKLFALDAADGGAWSNLSASVFPAPVRTVFKGTAAYLEMKIPAPLRNRLSHLYTITRFSGSMRTDIIREELTPGTSLSRPAPAGKGIFAMVLIFPKTTEVLVSAHMPPVPGVSEPGRQE